MAFRPKRFSDAEEGVGNLFVADTTERMINEFTPDGTETIFASDFHPDFLAFELILPGQFLNISTRHLAQTGDNVLIGGFILAGDTPKEVVLHAIGPSLADLDPPLAGVLADPVFELHTPDGTVMTNDNWRSDQEAQIEGTGLAPSNDLESALIVTLDPGSYTVIVRGADGGTGVAMVEAYNRDRASGESANISTRGFVGGGGDCMIGGLSSTLRKVRGFCSARSDRRWLTRVFPIRCSILCWSCTTEMATSSRAMMTGPIPPKGNRSYRSRTAGFTRIRDPRQSGGRKLRRDPPRQRALARWKCITRPDREPRHSRYLNRDTGVGGVEGAVHALNSQSSLENSAGGLPRLSSLPKLFWESFNNSLRYL
ncbi:MAG TPA: hypothetical protein VGF73_12315 [Chthoniobacterales bacterium]|jgi:hypothetical protein